MRGESFGKVYTKLQSQKPLEMSPLALDIESHSAAHGYMQMQEGGLSGFRKGYFGWQAIQWV